MEVVVRSTIAGDLAQHHGIRHQHPGAKPPGAHLQLRAFHPHGRQAPPTRPQFGKVRRRGPLARETQSHHLAPVDKFVASNRDQVVRFHPGGRHLVSCPRRQARKGPHPGVVQRPGQHLVVIAAEPAASRNRRPGPDGREPGISIVDHDGSTDHRIAVSQHVVRSIRIHQHWVSLDAVPIEPHLQGPVHQVDEIEALPLRHHRAARGVDDIEIADKSHLAVGAHRKGVAIFRPEDVVNDAHVPGTGLQSHRVPKSLVDGVVLDGENRASLGLHQEPLVGVVVDRIVQDRARPKSPRQYSHSVGENLVVTNQVGTLGYHSRM